MNIVITGASRGIGRSIVKEFNLEGKHNIVAIARNGKDLEALKAECFKANPNSKVIPVACDLVQLEANWQTVLDIIKPLQHIDILINNAATLINKPFDETSSKDFLELYKINVFSIVSLTQLLLPMMGKVSHSHIVNISSVGGVQGSVKFPGLSAYSSSKAALIGLTECLAVELKLQHISVNCLALGSVQTGMLAEAFPNYKTPMTPEKMAQFIAEFAMKGHQYLNGKVIPVSLSTP